MQPTIGLPPVVGDDARVLILGSLPSVRSVELQQYYAFPTNAFWVIMGALVDAGRELSYPDRLSILKARKIALWDALASSVRAGSLDQSIDQRTAQPNDFAGFLRRNRRIRLIAFNGRASQASFQRFADSDQGVTLAHCEQILLPSTSAANTSMTVQEKIRAWSVITGYLPAVKGA